MAPAKVTDANFDAEVLNSSEPVVVDFFAEWCGPCKAMAPALEEVAKIDVDECPDITNRYQIQAMPTLIIFKDGEIAARHTGAMVQKSKLQAWIDESV
jgi:thioredoxin 1